MIRLPPASPSRRTDTGTIARSASGASSTVAANRRRAPAAIASTTSFSLTPSRWRIESRRVSETSPVTRVRPGPSVAVEKRGRGRAQRLLGEREGGAADRLGDARGAAGGEAERRRAPRRPELVDGRVGDRVDRDPQTGGRRFGLPGRGTRLLLDSRGEVEQERPQLDGGDAVDHRVVDLAGDRRAGLLRARALTRISQSGRRRSSCCERNSSHSSRSSAFADQLPGNEPACDCAEVEVWVVRPCRLSKRHRPDHLAETRREMQTRRDPFPQQPRVQGTRPLWETQTREPSHMHVGSGGLDAEKRGVERREPVHREDRSSRGGVAFAIARRLGSGRGRCTGGLEYRSSAVRTLF